MGYLEATARLFPGLATQGQAQFLAQVIATEQVAERDQRASDSARQTAILVAQERAYEALLRLGLDEGARFSSVVIQGRGVNGGAVRFGDLAFTGAGAGVNVYTLGSGNTWAYFGFADTPGDLWGLLRRLAQVRDGERTPAEVNLPLDVAADPPPRTPEALATAALLAYRERQRVIREEAQVREDAEWQRQCDGLAARLRDTLGVAVTHTDLTRLMVEDDGDRHAVVIAKWGAQEYALDNRGNLCVVRFCPTCEVRITARTRIHGLEDLGAYIAGLPEITDAPTCPGCPGGFGAEAAPPALKPPTMAERLEAMIREIAAEEAQNVTLGL